VDARLVIDQFEWSALARLAPSFTHEWSWAQLCAERIRVITFRKVDITPVYLRTWVGDDLVGCPLLLYGEPPARRVIVVPRSSPAILTGDTDPVAAVRAAMPTVELVDDDVGAQIADLSDRLGEGTSRSWSVSDRDMTTIADAVTWTSEHERNVWCRWVTRFWRASGWNPELVAHRGDGAVVGWTIRTHRRVGVDTAMAVAVGEPAPPWMSHGLRS
jgi:hypothetical protein